MWLVQTIHRIKVCKEEAISDERYLKENGLNRLSPRTAKGKFRQKQTKDFGPTGKCR